MLLLVLILVLGAFGLLVLALVQGSVLWAWLSVVISVGAATALLVDWWQRQQALRAEELPLPARSDRRPPQSGRPQSGRVDFDSVTEFIPVIPQAGYGGAQPGAETRFIPGGSGAAAPSGSSAPGAPAASAAPTESSSEVERTVLLPFSRPSGSADQPPGATPPSQSWAGGPSQNVTEADGQPVDSTPSLVAGERTGSAVAPGDETILRPVEADGSPGGGSNGAAVPPGEVTSMAVPPGEVTSMAMPSGEVTSMAMPSGEVTSMAMPSGEVTSMAPIDAPPPGAALPPAGPDGEPPEEPHVPVAVAIIAQLQDEVIVVDERPRYHVAGCSFLPGRPVIPLPAAEAVELGFGPCGWCAPNRTLADRHRTAAR